jgi:hypothetical protein
VTLVCHLRVRCVLAQAAQATHAHTSSTHARTAYVVAATAELWDVGLLCGVVDWREDDHCDGHSRNCTPGDWAAGHTL